VAQVAISQGNGSTVEADDAKGIVTTMDVGSRFQYAAVLPGLQGVTPTPAAAIPVAAPVMPAYQIDPGVDISNPDLDADNDGLTNHFESVIGTNPTLADTDLDGLIDGFEASLGTDPTKMDTDLDGFTDGSEVHFGMNPLSAAAGPGLPGSGLPGSGGSGSGLPSPFEPEADPGALDDPAHVDAGLEIH
jgi:hypothetical protein